MKGDSPTAKTNNTSAVHKTKNLTVDEAWDNLYRRADEMLQSYKKILEFYSKWLSNLFPYIQRINHFKRRDAWTAVDTLKEIADQFELLMKMGAKPSLLDAVQKCKDGFMAPPETLAAKRTFVDCVLNLVESMVTENPKKKFSVENAPCRKNVRGSFTKLAEETQKCMKDVVNYSVLFIAEAGIPDPSDNETPKKDSTQNGIARQIPEPRFHSPAEPSVRSDWERSKLKNVSPRFHDSARSTFTRIKPVAGANILLDDDWDYEDEEISHLCLRSYEEKHPLYLDDPFEAGDVTGGYVTPTRSPSPDYSSDDYPPTPVKGLPAPGSRCELLFDDCHAGESENEMYTPRYHVAFAAGDGDGNLVPDDPVFPRGRGGVDKRPRGAVADLATQEDTASPDEDDNGEGSGSGAESSRRVRK